ncbi:TPA: SET domain-containing protein, partial [Salmonella bongori]|nr:SET domain-containing protein [Salmonella bongori]HDJ2745850.1 SET domain-containing protein [Salmonella bongori]HDJ2753208.1 SET domain-containing protein [Salmonella bongori]
MRGIGTIIPFRSLTGSDPEMPEFSGAWSSIKDYFPLHVQDEVALCFRVFYQPDEGVSAQDRLKHFLRLKTLAFPGRQDSFTADRMHGTGETICAIASGSSSVFPSVTLSLSDQEWQSVQPQEEKADSSLSSVSEDSRETTATESTGTRPKGTPITNEQLQTWRDLPQEAKREAGGWKKWAQAQGISTGSALALLSNIGLTARGEARIKSLENKGSPITETQLLMWFNMSPEERSEAGGWVKWTQAQGISITSAQKYLTNSGLTSFGITRLQSPQEKGVPITRTHIQTWWDLPQEMKRETGGWVKWAQAQGIAISGAKKYLTNTGLTPYGKERLQSPGEKGSYITVTQLLAWFNMSPEARRETGGAKTWARTQGIATSSVRKYLTDSGLTSRGIERLQHDEDRGSTITDKQIQAWQDLPQEAKNEAGGWIAWAQTQGISISNARLYLTNSGLTFRGMTHLKSPEERGSVITKTQIQTWQDMSPAEKREAGGWIAWAQAQGISFSSAGVYLTHRGLTPRGISRLQSAKGRNASISNAQIQAWRDLPQEMKREAGGWTKWAQAQGISLWSAKNYLTNSGLTPRGAERLQSTEEKGTLITETQILEWFNMSPTARHEAGGWMPWAKSQGISISNAYSYLTNNGLTRRGMERLQSPEKRISRITKEQLQAWLNMSPEARSEVGDWRIWAQAQGISINSARKYLTNAGLTPLGMERLQPHEERGSAITKTQIRTWQKLPQEAKREAGGWRAWAQAQGISILNASTYLTNTGLTVIGMERLQPLKERGSPITEAQLLAWFSMSPEERRTSGGWATWAQAQGISYRSAKKYLTLTDSEIPSGRTRPSPSATVTSASQEASAAAGKEDVRMSTPSESIGDKRSLPWAEEDISAPQAKQIKKEEDAVTWRTHQIDNNLPILQHWRDPTVSVMEQAEGGKEALQVTLWGSLFNRLPRRIKVRINQDIQWFLQNEGNHDARMNDMMTVSIPLDDSDGYRG